MHSISSATLLSAGPPAPLSSPPPSRRVSLLFTDLCREYDPFVVRPTPSPTDAIYRSYAAVSSICANRILSLATSVNQQRIINARTPNSGRVYDELVLSTSTRALDAQSYAIAHIETEMMEETIRMNHRTRKSMAMSGGPTMNGGQQNGGDMEISR